MVGELWCKGRGQISLNDSDTFYHHFQSPLGKNFSQPSQSKRKARIPATAIIKHTTINNQLPIRDGSGPPPASDFFRMRLFDGIPSWEVGDSQPQYGQILAPQCTNRRHFRHSEGAIVTLLHKLPKFIQPVCHPRIWSIWPFWPYYIPVIYLAWQRRGQIPCCSYVFLIKVISIVTLN